MRVSSPFISSLSGPRSGLQAGCTSVAFTFGCKPAMIESQAFLLGSLYYVTGLVYLLLCSQNNWSLTVGAVCPDSDTCARVSF